MMPSPPARDTAEANWVRAIQPIGACTIGYLAPVWARTRFMLSVANESEKGGRIRDHAMACSAHRQSRRGRSACFVLVPQPAKVRAEVAPEMTAKKPNILLSEASNLSSREAITALGLAGHRVELVSSDPFCLGRFSRFVSRVHRAPASGADPDGYLTKVIEVV